MSDADKKYNQSEKGKRRNEIYEKSEKGKERRRKAFYKAYGIDLEKYDEMLVKQNGCCAICGKTNNNGDRFCVDHSHKTGKIRSLLCYTCNSILGLVHEDIDRLYKYIDYLENNKSVV